MKYAFTNGILLDGRKDMKPQTGKTILVENGKISAIAEGFTDLSGYEIIDLAGKYIMPGLINLHVHMPAGGKTSMKQSDNAKLVRLVTATAAGRAILKKVCANFAKTELMSGVTTLRSVGGVLDVDAKIRDEINAGKLDGPRMLAANMAVSVPGGHMAGSLAYEAHSAEEAAELVRKIAATKPDLIKLMITGGVLDAKKKGEPGEMKMPPEYIKVACEEAHKLGYPVAAHVESPEGVKAALEGGVDTIEHGARLTDELVELFKKNGSKIVATISPALPFAFFDQASTGLSELDAYNGKFLYEAELDCYRRAMEEGIPLGIGTDVGCPYVTHYDTWRELAYFVKYLGTSPEFALYTATLGNAQIAGIDSVTGSVEPGKDADLLITEKNPLEGMKALANISMVMTRGRLYKHPTLKKKAKVEAALNPLL